MGAEPRGAVSIGVFDGLHLGHRAILERALAHARERDGECVVLTFDPHPDVVLSKDAFRIPTPLTPLREKRARLSALGVHRLDVLPFTREMAALSPEAFIERYVLAPHAPHAVVVGEGFALGRGRVGDTTRLRAIGQQHGFELDAVPLFHLDGAPVSSTRIRELLAEGRVAEAARPLGRDYALDGRVVTGTAIGRTLGFPTANLQLHEEKLVPRDGIYAVRVGIGDQAPDRPGAMSIGMRPTFAGTTRTLEVHLIDFEGELVGRELTVEFIGWLRAEQRFDGPAPLIEAMRADVVEARRVVASRNAPG